MRGVWLRIRRLLRWRQAEREIDEELRSHVEMETEALVRKGVDPREARRRALVAFGGEERYREQTRGARATDWLEDGLRDTRYAVRALRHSPGFALSALATLALGIGATAGVYGVVRGVVLAPLAYPQPDELVTIWMSNPAQGIDEDITSWPNFADWRARSRSIEHMAAVRGGRWALTGPGDAQEVRGAAVSRGFFELMGAPLVLGRGFAEQEAEGDRIRVVVLSHELWTRRFGADRGIVGRTIELDDEAWEVVGVTAPGQRYPRDAELWTPLSGPLLDDLREARGALWLPVVGRLAEGVSMGAAQRELDAVAAALRSEYPDENEGIGITLEPLHETLVGDVRAPMIVLLGAAWLVLLIAVVNVANLQLARGTARTREVALRLALGAGKGRVMRQLLAESLVLGVLGGLLGAALAAGAVEMLVRFAPPDLPRLEEVAADPGLVFAGLGVAVLSSVLFGFAPALHAGRVDARARLDDGARGGTSGGLVRLRGLFATGQFALALVLLVGAGLLVQSFERLSRLDPGFAPEGVLSATLSLPSSRYPNGDAVRPFTDELLAEVRALPGVEAAATMSTLFLADLADMGPVSIASRPELSDQERRRSPVVQDAASVGFLEATGMELLAGRPFEDADGPDARRVAIVNEAFVRAFLPDRDPLGERFMWGRPQGDNPQWITIVGIARDARRAGLAGQVRPSAFLPWRQSSDSRMDVLVRTSGDPAALGPALRDAVARIDPRLPVTRVRTLEQAMSEALSARRFVMLLLAAFALSATALAAVGIYGVMAYVVGQRRREIGIRVALGAERGQMLRRVVGEGLANVGVGLALGVVSALSLTGVLRSQLYGLEPTDPLTFALATASLVLVAALACLLPARRAATLDPMRVLREE